MQKHSKEKSLDKAKGGMIGKLKKLINEPKIDHYQAFKKQHKIK